MPFGVPGWRWEVGRFGYMMEKESDCGEIKAKARDLLEKISKGATWRCRCGSLHVPLLIEGEIIGGLWEDVEPGEVDIGAYRFGRWRTKVQLVKDGRMVGFLWLA
ncbi:hypothetical protein [Thermococcus sp. 2319x1]|uniref:hypothetical protein n=1 Tax=Thermococcus sp. 2319x1 TaxID=1674923 RepID=UPI0015842AB0|nr:hypothetical protein [Thermococcus sp. 2319x1]